MRKPWSIGVAELARVQRRYVDGIFGFGVQRFKWQPPAIPVSVGLVPAERQLVSYRQSAPKLLSTVLAGPGGQ